MAQAEFPLQAAEAKEAPVPSTFWQYVKSWGPGIVVVLTWLGAGDLVDASVAGANYGYALMWALALSLVIRFGLVSLIAKFQLMNQKGISILDGYARIHRAMPMVIGISAVLLFHFYNSYTVKGTGNALAHIAGFGDVLVWSIVTVIGAFLVTHKAYGPVEKTMYVLLAIMVVTLMGTAIWLKPDPVGVATGIFGFAVPSQVGPFGAIVVAVSLIGAVGGSLANLLYPYFMVEKGWTKPKYRKVQMYDLAFGTFCIIAIDLAVWIVGAEVLNTRGIVIESVDDMARMLSEVMGSAGNIIFYLGVFGACFSSVLGYAFGGPMILKDAIRVTFPDRAAKYPDMNRDPWVQFAYFFIFVGALVWAIPGMPGFVWLSVTVNAVQIILLPLVSVGLLIIMNRLDLMGARKNGLIANAFLVLLTGLALWGAYQVLIGLGATFSNMFG